MRRSFSHRPCFLKSSRLWHSTSVCHLSLQKRLVMFTTTHFKPWPLTSACNWRNSSKWQDALAGLGPVETLLPATVTVTRVTFASAQRAELCRPPSHSVSHLRPICSGLERAGLLLLPNENGFRAAIAGTSQIPNRKAAKWKDRGLGTGLFPSLAPAVWALQAWFWLFGDLSHSLEFPVFWFPSLWNEEDNITVPTLHCCHGEEMGWSLWKGVWPVVKPCIWWVDKLATLRNWCGSVVT